MGVDFNSVSWFGTELLEVAMTEQMEALLSPYAKNYNEEHGICLLECSEDLNMHALEPHPSVVLEVIPEYYRRNRGDRLYLRHVGVRAALSAWAKGDAVNLPDLEGVRAEFRAVAELLGLEFDLDKIGWKECVYAS